MRRSTSTSIKTRRHEASAYQQQVFSDIKLREIGEPRIWDFAAEIGLWVPLVEWVAPPAEATPWWWGQEASQDVKISASGGPDATIESLRIFHAQSQKSSAAEVKARSLHQLHAARKRRPETAARFMIWVPQVVWTNSTQDYTEKELSTVLARAEGHQKTELSSSTDEISIENPPKAVKSTRPTEYLAALAQDIPLIDYFHKGRNGTDAIHEGVVEFTSTLEDGLLAGFKVTQRSAQDKSSKNRSAPDDTATIPRTPRSLAERELWMSHAHMSCNHANPEQARKRGWCIAPNSERRHESVTVSTQSGTGDSDAVEVRLTHGTPLEFGTGQYRVSENGTPLKSRTDASQTGLNQTQTMASPSYVTELGIRTVLSWCSRKHQQVDHKLSSDTAGVKLQAKRRPDGTSFDVYDFAFTNSDGNADQISSQACDYSKPEVLAQQGVWVPLAQYTSRWQEDAASSSPSRKGFVAPTKHWTTRAYFDAEGRLVRFSMQAPPQRQPSTNQSSEPYNVRDKAGSVAVLVLVMIGIWMIAKKRKTPAQIQQQAT